MTPHGDTEFREWQVPPANATESRKLGWINEACQEGEHWNKSQRGYDDWLKGLDILSGNHKPKERLEYRSDLSANRLKTNIRVAISGLASIRPWSGYQASEDLKNQALFMNLTTRALYLSNFWDQSIKSALQWAGATCTGYIRPVYRRGWAGQGRGNIELDTCGQPSVLPIQVPADGNLNRAYAVTYLDEKPIWEAHGMFPDFQDRLRPTSSRYWYSSQIRSAARENAGRHWNPFTRSRGNEGKISDNLIPLRYTRINDLSVNATGSTIPMGQPGSAWAYDVPAMGTQLPNGETAGANDARMYPFGRLFISSENCVLYDGPDYYWHGELNLIPFCLDRWPWEPIGFSMIHDGWRIQRAIDVIDRGTMDKISADLDRPLAYNMNAVSKREANAVDLMQPRQRIAFDGDAVDKPFSPIAPDEVYRVSAESLAFRKELEASMDYTLQSRDIVELGKARALGKGMDQLEALISASGPLVKDMSRSMERSVCQLAGQVKYLVLQYMDTSRLIPYITEAGINQVFDYNPSELVPSHLPGENPEEGSPSTRVKRARWFADSLQFTMTPHSIHEIHQMSYRLMLMQLRQRGYPIAACDIMEANDVPDVKRASGSTTQDRFYAEKQEELEEMQRLQLSAAGMGIDVGAMMGGGKKPEGRQPSGQKPPQMKTKGDGRPVVTES
jgi:hypothetical protein